MLVSKVIEVSDTPVEILAGEDTSQAYALYLTPDVSGAWIGGPDVVADTGSGATVSGLSGPTYPMLIQGESPVGRHWRQHRVRSGARSLDSGVI